MKRLAMVLLGVAAVFTFAMAVDWAVYKARYIHISGDSEINETYDAGADDLVIEGDAGSAGASVQSDAMAQLQFLGNDTASTTDRATFYRDDTTLETGIYAGTSGGDGTGDIVLRSGDAYLIRGEHGSGAGVGRVYILETAIFEDAVEMNGVFQGDEGGTMSKNVTFLGDSGSGYAWNTSESSTTCIGAAYNGPTFDFGACTGGAVDTQLTRAAAGVLRVSEPSSPASTCIDLASPDGSWSRCCVSDVDLFTCTGL